jgi:hypothetical protein
MPATSHKPSAAAGRFLRSWLLWVTLGESAGFLAPILLQQLGTISSVPLFPLLVGAGLVEGALLGWSQAHVLRETFPGSLPRQPRGQLGCWPSWPSQCLSGTRARNQGLPRSSEYLPAEPWRP